MIALPTLLGAVQLTVADPFPPAAVTPAGAPGAVAPDVVEYTTSTQ